MRCRNHCFLSLILRCSQSLCWEMNPYKVSLALLSFASRAQFSVDELMFSTAGHQTQRHSLKITAEVVDSSKHKHSRSSVFQRLGKPVNNNADDDNPKPATVIRNHDEAYRLHLEKLKRSKLPNQPTNQLHSNEQPKAETNVGRAPVMKDTCSNVVDEDITRLSRYLIHMRSLKSAKNISTVTRYIVY